MSCKRSLMVNKRFMQLNNNIFMILNKVHSVWKVWVFRFQWLFVKFMIYFHSQVMWMTQMKCKSSVMSGLGLEDLYLLKWKCKWHRHGSLQKHIQCELALIKVLISSLRMNHVTRFYHSISVGSSFHPDWLTAKTPVSLIPSFTQNSSLCARRLGIDYSAGCKIKLFIHFFLYSFRHQHHLHYSCLSVWIGHKFQAEGFRIGT